MTKAMFPKGFIYSGTLGDSFIAFLKFKVLCQLNPSFPKSLLCLEETPIYHGQKDELFSDLFGGKAALEHRPVKNLEYEVVQLRQAGFAYISTQWDTSQVPTWQRDTIPIPHDAIVKTQAMTLKPDEKTRLAINVESGKPRGNNKAFEVKWLGRILSDLNARDYEITLIGPNYTWKKTTSEYFSQFGNIVDLVGKLAFNDYLSRLRTQHILMSPEGFPAFYAMYNGVQTISFFTDYEAFARVHPQWFSNAVMLNAGMKSNIARRIRVKTNMVLHNRVPRLKPLLPSQIVDLVNGKRLQLANVEA